MADQEQDRRDELFACTSHGSELFTIGSDGTITKGPGWTNEQAVAQKFLKVLEDQTKEIANAQLRRCAGHLRQLANAYTATKQEVNPGHLEIIAGELERWQT